MWVSQSRYLYEVLWYSRFILQAKGLKVPIRLSVYINNVFLSLDIDFQLSNFPISEKKKINPTL